MVFQPAELGQPLAPWPLKHACQSGSVGSCARAHSSFMRPLAEMGARALGVGDDASAELAAE